ncbi:MAG: type II secretion system F family protein [Alphaproteobacteria bacterium]|uniref:Type II secretion system F family protein n=1 Tax=Brevundimonas mediterranea TaxID=74329 RepID=A0A6G7EG52_9CAUL|nr:MULTISPECIES: type II secretion system F family protein [Brevundimonas]MBU1271158.1 type II secretion system F family protein [Alphaproteobacteria bacterium]MDZ4321334.1 type II secretion system F family protein [Phenylobacterium sp.]OGN48317.1 MAG: type II secretion system protein [Caulobacterales bacterium RIFCSPHIGHO2_12_FULL_68_13]OYX80696.1 MAG: type II secretion system protein [Brevundimonas sp. 32-68-21]EDX81031.1 Bacterial type II secretion system protein F domain [Brevundimonas sp.
MDAFIRFITDPQNLLSLGVGVLVFATVLTLLSSMTGGVKLDQRMKAVSERRDELKRRSRAAIHTGPGGLRHTDDEGFKKRVVDRLNLTKLLEDPKVADQMAQAGYRGPRPLTTFYFFRFASPFIFLMVVAFYMFVIKVVDWPTMQKITACVAAAVAGFYAPNLFLTNRITKRRTSIMQAFPDALDLLLICVEAGMSIEAAIAKVSQEIGTSSIELAEELSLLSAELSYLPDRRMAYENLGKRTNHPGVKSVAVAMTQAETYGTPLSSALRVMAKENRDLRLSAAEKKAAALPAQLTVPMILFFLPVLFIVILGPAILNIMDTMAKG